MSGVGITGKIVPKNGGAFPVFEDVYGQGGYRSVATIADRNAVAANDLFCKEGMVVFVEELKCGYLLADDLATWVFAAPSRALASQPHWYVDPATGNDNNTGKLGFPLATQEELGRRIFPGGGPCMMTVDVTIHLAAGSYLGGFLSAGSADGTLRTMTLECAITSSAPITLTNVVQTDAATKTRGQLTTGAGTFVNHERIRLTSGASSGAVAYSMGLNANPQNTYVSLFSFVSFGDFHNPSSATIGDTCVVDTLQVQIRRLELWAGVNARIAVKDAIIIRATVNGASEATPSSDAGGNVLFSGCQAISVAGFWQTSAGGACCFGCRWVPTTRTALKGNGWLLFGCVTQGIFGVAEGSVHSYGFTIDGGALVLGTDGDPNGAPNHAQATFVANRSYINGGSIEVENGPVAYGTGAAVQVLNGGRFIIGDFVFCEQWGASTPYAIGYFVEPGAYMYQEQPGATTLRTNFDIPSLVNLNIGGLEFDYSSNPISLESQNCGLIAIGSNTGAISQMNGGFYRTAQLANVAPTNFPGLTKTGLYQVSGYLATTTADVAASGVPVLNVIFTDDSGVARTVPVATLANLTTLGGASGFAIIESNGTQIQWSITGIVTPLTARFSARCCIEKISNGA